MVDPSNNHPSTTSAESTTPSGNGAFLASDAWDRLQDVTAATSRLLRAADPEAAVPDVLHRIGEAFAADAASIYVYSDAAAGGPTELHRWSASDTAPPVDPGRTVPSPSGAGGTDELSPSAPAAPVGAEQRGSALTLTLPIVVDGATWGKLLLETNDPEVQWSREEVAVLEMMADHFGAALTRPTPPSGADAANGSRPSGSQTSSVQSASTAGTHRSAGRCDDAPAEAAATAQGHQGGDAPPLDLQRRVRAERALVEASKLLVSSEACDYNRLLEIVGEATGARYAYLVVITPQDVVSYPDEETPAFERDQPIQLDTYTQYEWFSSEAAASVGGNDDAGPTFAVPILSSDDQLFGYVGIEYETASAPCRDEDARILSVLGDMLCSYLQRQISEEALRRSEQRYRYFVDTISEAIWRIDFTEPISVDAPDDEQVDALLHNGVVAECNAAMARLFSLERPKQLVGRTIHRIADITGRQIVRELVAAGYRLRNHEYVVRAGNEREHHLVINTVGVREDGMLVGLWGSCTEVTERVELERRMVAALERQQQRIGRDLHDRVGQQLAGTRMLVQNLADRHFPDEDQPGRRMIDRVVSYVREATQHVNDLQRGVMPVQVERDGLAQALVELSSRTDMLAEISCVYSHDGETDVLHHETKLQLYRIAQEATRNAVTHGRPSRIDVELFAEDGDVVVRVSDDGVGFTHPADPSSGRSFGLHSMKYRARAIGARLDIDSEPDQGTVVTCRLSRDRIAS